MRHSGIPRCTHTPNLEFLPQENKRYAPDTIILKTRSEVKVKVTVTREMVCDTPSSQDAFTHQI